MDKLTYLAELAEGLARWVPERERQDILRYYAEYFEEAGPEREAEVVEELGDPWALSSRLAVEGGYVTQLQADSWTPKKRKVWPWVVAGAAAVLVFLIGSIVSALVGFGWHITQMVTGRVFGANPVQTSDVFVVEEGLVPGRFDGVTYGDGGFWSVEDGCLAPFYAIDAEISMGNITVTSGEDYTLYIDQSGNLGGYSLKWEIQGDTLKIRDDSSGGHFGLDGLGDLVNGGQKGVDVVITVPEGEVLQRVTAKTDFGDVRVLDLGVEVKVTAETSMGNVEGYELRMAEKVELKTDMGNVTFGMSDELYEGMDIELKTNLGDVEANMACRETDCEYELETDLGQVSINGVDRGSKAERKGNMLCKLDAESDLGNVAVYFYEGQRQ